MGPSDTKTSIQTDVSPPLLWNLTEVLAYVRQVVHKAIEKEIEDDAHILEQCCVDDGSQAAFIRNNLIHAVSRARNGAARDIYPDFVSTNPTIARLAERLLAIVHTTPRTNHDDATLKLQEIGGMISDFSAHFPEHRPTDSWKALSGEVVLLTGSTGGLGSQLLAHLASSPEVYHVYALNRRSRDGKTLRDRQSDAFLERDLDVRVIDSPKVTLVEGDTGINNLGIDPQLFKEIRDNTTLIIHNAWKVSFIADLGTFKSNIRALRTLIDLALGSPRPNPPRFIFTSSVTVFKRWDAEQGRPLEAPIDDPTIVLGSGYSESKFVGESILEIAAKTSSLRPIIVRIGQLTGTSNGAWEATNWPPVIILSGQRLGVLPGRDDCIAWLSFEVAAEAIFEFRNSESQYLHLAHPNPVSWNSVFDVFSLRMNVPLVSWSEWWARFEAKYAGSSSLRLFQVYHECCHPISLANREGPGLPLMDMRQALKASPTLADPFLPQIGRDDAERWVRHWRKTGHLSNDGAKL